MDLEMQVRPGRVAGRAHLPDDLARGHVARGAHVLGQVVVDVAVPVVAGDVRAHAATAAVAEGEVAAHYRELGHAHRAVDVVPGVKPPAARAEVVTERGTGQRAHHPVYDLYRADRDIGKPCVDYLVLALELVE